MRQYIRHPSDIPIDYILNQGEIQKKENVNNISQGGLSFRTTVNIDPGAAILIRIPIRKPTFEAKGMVVWCRKANKHYDVGVRFADRNTELGIRMVEQVCYIEQYRREILQREGRKLSGEEAAVEWIKKYAKDFPR